MAGPAAKWVSFMGREVSAGWDGKAVVAAVVAGVRRRGRPDDSQHLTQLN